MYHPVGSIPTSKMRVLGLGKETPMGILKLGKEL